MTDIIEQLRGDIPHRLIESHWTVDFEALDAERKEAADEIDRLRKALTPFANAASDWAAFTDCHEDHIVEGWPEATDNMTSIQVKHLVEARNVVEGK